MSDLAAHRRRYAEELRELARIETDALVELWGEDPTRFVRAVEDRASGGGERADGEARLLPARVTWPLGPTVSASTAV